MNFEHRAFFGEGMFAFALTTPMVIELEQNTNTPIGVLCDRVFKRQFAHNDLLEVIRLALIGAGMEPKRAAALVATYVADRPFTETHPLARDILLARYLGNPEEGNGQD
jgi:hypothetical protein